MTDFENSPFPYIVSDTGYYHKGTTNVQYESWHIYDNGIGTYERWIGEVEKAPFNIDINLGQEFNYENLEKIELLPGNHIDSDYNERSVPDTPRPEGRGFLSIIKF